MGIKKDNPMQSFFREGSNAFITGKLDRKGFLNSNPYNVGSVKFREWERGFNFAYAENIRKKLGYANKTRKRN